MSTPEGNTVSLTQWLAALPNHLDGKGRVDVRLLRVVQAVATFADHQTGRNAWPSHETIAARAHCTISTVQRKLKVAEELKWLLRHERLSPVKTVGYDVNLDADLVAGWLPWDAREHHRRELTAARVRAYRERKRAELISVRECVTPATVELPTSANVSVSKCVTEELISVRECVTQPPVTHSLTDNLSLDLPIKTPTQGTTDAAAASTADEILDAELIDDELPGAEGPPLLALDPPSAELAMRESTVPAVADLSASWLLPELAETGKRKSSAPVDAPRYNAEAWLLPREPKTPATWTRELVGYWVERCREFEFEPSKRQIGQVGKEVRGLVASGNNPNHVAAACRRAAERRGAWIMRAMADVQPGNWSAVRQGKQIVTERGVMTMPAGMAHSDRRHVAVSIGFGVV